MRRRPAPAGDVVLEVAGGVPVLLGQRHPQLDAVEELGFRCGHLRVADAVPTGHQVHFARSDPGEGAEAVAVLDLAGEQPAHRLEAGVGVRWEVHAARSRDFDRAVVVGEAPRPDEGPGPLRERSADVKGPRSAQRHVPWFEHVDLRLPRRPVGLMGAPHRSASGAVSALLIETDSHAN
ncbi:hypothetical protein GCM10029992_14000 [Glycomyces albus]